jgi:hypothetical protein
MPFLRRMERQRYKAGEQGYARSMYDRLKTRAGKIRIIKRNLDTILSNTDSCAD